MDCNNPKNSRVKIKICAPHICRYTKSSNGKQTCTLSYPTLKLIDKGVANTKANREKIMASQNYKGDNINAKFLSQHIRLNFGDKYSDEVLGVAPKKSVSEVETRDQSVTETRVLPTRQPVWPVRFNVNTNRQTQVTSRDRYRDRQYNNYNQPRELSNTVTTYENHVWLIQTESGRDIVLFWLTRKNCQTWWLTVKSDFSVGYGTKRCRFENDDHKIVIGEKAIKRELQSGRRTSSGDLSQVVQLKIINESGERLAIKWVDYDGVMHDYSSNING